MIKNVIFRNRKKNIVFVQNCDFRIFLEILKFQGIHAIIEFQVFRFLFFFLFLTSRNSYENKIQEYSAVIKFFSNWIYFLEIDRVLGHVT